MGERDESIGEGQEGNIYRSGQMARREEVEPNESTKGERKRGGTPGKDLREIRG